jgi:hypothetical protein
MPVFSCPAHDWANFGYLLRPDPPRRG